FPVVSRRNEVVQQHAVSYLARQLHHFHSGRADVNRNVLWRAIAVHDVDLDVFDLNKLAFEGDFLHREQTTDDLNSLTHSLKRFSPIDSHLCCERLPPDSEAAHHA